MTTLLALDISSARTGVAEGEIGQPPKFYSVRFKKSGEAENCDVFGEALGWFTSRLQMSKPDYLLVERRISMMLPKQDGEGNWRQTTSPKTADLLGGLGGVILGAASRCRIGRIRNAKTTDYTVAVSTVRALFLGKGNLRTDVAKRAARHMCEQLGWEASNDDEADSGAIWWWASWHIDQKRTPIVTPAMQTEARAFGEGRIDA